MFRVLNYFFSMLVYLRTNPEVVQKRIMQRARKEERAVPMSYIEALHKIHEDWLHHKSSHPVPAPVLEIDANTDLTEMLQQISAVEMQILNLHQHFNDQQDLSKLLRSPSKGAAVVGWEFNHQCINWGSMFLTFNWKRISYFPVAFSRITKPPKLAPFFYRCVFNSRNKCSIHVDLILK